MAFSMPRVESSSDISTMIKLLQRLQMLTWGELRSIKLVDGGLKLLKARRARVPLLFGGHLTLLKISVQCTILIAFRKANKGVIFWKIRKNADGWQLWHNHSNSKPKSLCHLGNYFIQEPKKHFRLYWYLQMLCYGCSGLWNDSTSAPYCCTTWI